MDERGVNEWGMFERGVNEVFVMYVNGVRS